MTVETDIIADRAIKRERKLDLELAVRIHIKHIDPGPSGYYLMLGQAILAGPKRREDFQ